MEVALQAPALVVLGSNQPLPRCAQLYQAGLQIGCKTHVLQHQPRLVRKVVEELLLDWGKCLAWALPDGQRPEQLILVAHLHGAGSVREGRELAVAYSDGLVPDDRLRGCRGRAKLTGRADPHRSVVGARALPQPPGHAGQPLIRSV